MKVTSIDITNLRYDSASACHEGHVTLQLCASKQDAPMHVHFVCHSSRSAGEPASLVTHDLVEDALRQAHRMPGYRRGERVLELAEAARKSVARAGSP